MPKYLFSEDSPFITKWIHLPRQEQLTQDPQLHVIPWAIWVEVFNYRMVFSYLELFSKEYSEAIHTLPSVPSLEALLCLFFAHAGCKAKIIDDFGRRAGYGPKIVQALTLMGDIECIKYFFTRLPAARAQEILAMINADNYFAVRWASEYGYKDILEYLIGLIPASDRVQERLAMIQTKNYQAFRLAARNGHKEILNYLINFIPEAIRADETLALIRTKNYRVFNSAARYGHQDILEYLVGLIPQEIRIKETLAMLDANNYGVFRSAALYGGKDILEYLVGLIPEEIRTVQTDLMVKADSYAAFRLAAMNANNIEAVNYLLHYPDCLAYAELHNIEYNYWVRPFITNKLKALKAEEEAYYQKHPHGVFNLEHQDCRLGFYMLRHLIRSNDLSKLRDICFLLSIPGIKILTHQEVTKKQPNELFHLVMGKDNLLMAALLLTVPAIRAHAEQNNFCAEMYIEPDLPVWARDAEAFMIDLTPDKSNRPQQYSGNISILEFFTSISCTETEQEFLMSTPNQSIH
ncbi:ankyrin repeat family protein [Legionella sainthelensi]|uniref:Ankyrin repeat family protein n=1 Tax=Legionella sainthelensi TaxID=28087 RepID=A0A0W0YJV0_9GAMM|nr:ankyrin repeat domain-containing protein [Legionella sainthelensi]KTD57127.1 ankyrin repeat family protein [Legionella sainthelensi]VEH37593.1 ankyrin repeat family protein [Legionella sainthelensi]